MMNGRNAVRVWAASLILVAPAVVAEDVAPWFLDDCPPENVKMAAKLRQKMLTAEPGSDVYVPHPFPQQDAAVIEDFEYQLLDSWAQQPRKTIPDDMWVLLSTVKRNGARYEILKVTEWRPQRCGAVYGQTDYRFVIRVFDRADGDEVARATLSEPGLLGKISTYPGSTEIRLGDGHVLESLREVRSMARGLGLKAGGFQYVALAGVTTACYDTVPCIAFRAAGQSYIYRSGELFEIDLQRHGVKGVKSNEFMNGGPTRTAAATAVHDGEHLITVGGWGLAVATPVATDN